MAADLQTNDEWTVHSINIHGVFFERWCQQIISEAEGWNLDSVNYPVEFPPANGPIRGKESALDIRASRDFSDHRTCLLIECKKNNPDFVDWVFFQKPNERLTQGFNISQVENKLRTTPVQGWDTESNINTYMSSYVVADEARETRGNYIEYSERKSKTKTSNAAIQEAAIQISLAKQAVVSEDAAYCQRVLVQSPSAEIPWSRKIYFPIIVTTARLLVCQFDSKAVVPATGEIAATETSLAEREALVYEYTLPRHLQFSPLNVVDSYKEGLTDTFTRQHILVVQSKHFPNFLRTFYNAEAASTKVPS